MPAVFNEPGSDATGDLTFYTVTVGTVASSTEQARSGSRSIKCDSTASGTAYVRKDSVLADAGRRISVGFYFSNFQTNPVGIIVPRTSADAGVFSLRVTSAGVLQLWNNSAQIGIDGSTLSTGQWYRITLTYTITSTTVNEFRVYLNDNTSADISVSNATLSATGTSALRLGWSVGTLNSGFILYLDDVHIDDSSSLAAFSGDIHVTAKKPASENTNNFDTAIGNARGSTDYDNVNEVPYSETNGWQHAAATDVQENYGLESASAGDEDLTGATLISRMAWLIGKRGAITDISVVGTGAEGSAGSGNITLNAPSGTPQNDDIWIAAIHSSDQVAHAFTDWTEIAQANGGGTTSRLSVWYHRYAGSTPNLTVTHSGGQSPIGGIISFRGCKTSGSPVNVSSAIAGGTDASIAHTAVTPTVAGCVLLAINGSADDNGRTALGGGYTVAWEDSGGGTQNCYDTTAGTPDGSVALNYDLDVPVSDTGTVTQTQAASDPWAAILVALEPQDTIGSPAIMDNGSETAITLTTSSALYTVITDSASYPSNAAGIGMRSGGGSVDTYLYECGTIIAYIPSGALTLLPGLIATGETFFSPTIAVGAVTLSPALIASAEQFFSPQVNFTLLMQALASSEAFFTPTIAPGGVNLAPGGVATGEAFFNPTLVPGGVSLFPALIPSAEQVFTPQLNLALLIPLLASGETFFTPTLAPGNVNLLPDAVATGEAFFSPQLNLTLLVQALATGEQFFQPTVTPGGVSLAPGVIASGETIFSPQLNLALLLSAVTTGEAFFALTLTHGTTILLPDTIVSAEAFFSPHTGLTLFLAAIATGEAFFDSTVAPGVVAVLPGTIPTGEAFFTPQVDLALLPPVIASGETFFGPQIDLTLLLAAIASGEAFFTPLIAGGAVALSPGIIGSGEVFFTSTLTLGGVNIAPGLIGSEETFFIPTLVPGEVLLQPGLVGSGEAFFGPLLTMGGVSLLPSLIASGETFVDPTFAFGGVNLLPGHITSGETFFTPILALGDNVLLPGVIGSEESFFNPTFALGGVFLLPSLIASGEAFFTPMLAPGGVVLLPDLVASGEVFFTPVPVLGEALLQPSTIVTGEAFFTHVFVTGGVNIQPSLIASGAQGFSPVLVPGGVSLVPDLVATGEAFFVPILSSVVFLQPGAITSGESIFLPTVAVGDAIIAVPLIASEEQLYALFLIIGQIMLGPFYVSAAEIHMPGASVAELHTPGANVADFHIPGSGVGDVHVPGAQSGELHTPGASVGEMNA